MAKNKIEVLPTSLVVPLYVFRGGKKGGRKQGISIACKDPRYQFTLGAAKFGKLTAELEKMLSELVDKSDKGGDEDKRSI